MEKAGDVVGRTFGELARKAGKGGLFEPYETEKEKLLGKVAAASVDDATYELLKKLREAIQIFVAQHNYPVASEVEKALTQEFAKLVNAKKVSSSTAAKVMNLWMSRYRSFKRKQGAN